MHGQELTADERVMTSLYNINAVVMILVLKYQKGVSSVFICAFGNRAMSDGTDQKKNNKML